MSFVKITPMNPIAPIDIPPLVNFLINGDEKAFCSIFPQLGPKIYGTARRIFFSQESAEKIVQQVFLKICKKREHLKDDLSFEANMITIMLGSILANHPSMPPPDYN